MFSNPLPKNRFIAYRIIKWKKQWRRDISFLFTAMKYERLSQSDIIIIIIDKEIFFFIFSEVEKKFFFPNFQYDALEYEIKILLSFIIF